MNIKKCVRKSTILKYQKNTMDFSISKITQYTLSVSVFVIFFYKSVCMIQSLIRMIIARRLVRSNDCNERAPLIMSDARCAPQLTRAVSHDVPLITPDTCCRFRGWRRWRWQWTRWSVVWLVQSPNDGRCTSYGRLLQRAVLLPVTTGIVQT